MMRALVIVATVSTLGCGDPDAERYRRQQAEWWQQTRQKGIDACIAQGGVPILKSWDHSLGDCKFPGARP